MKNFILYGVKEIGKALLMVFAMVMMLVLLAGCNAITEKTEVKSLASVGVMTNVCEITLANDQEAIPILFALNSFYITEVNIHEAGKCCS